MYVYRLYSFFVLSLIVVAAENATPKKPEKFQYPLLKRDESVVDDYYGTKVVDPYRYLEDVSSPEVENFVKEQNKLTSDYLARSSIKEKIEKKITEVYNYPKYDVPKRYGTRYYTSMNTGLQNQNAYYVQDSLQDEPRVFFDPNTLSADANGTVHLGDITFSEDGQLVSLGLQSKGSDWMTVRFRNTSSGEDYPETLSNIIFSNIAWSKDGLGVFYACYPKLETKSTKSSSSPGTETYKYANQKLYYHRIGTKQTDDVLLLEFDDPELLIGYFEITDDGKNLLLFPRKQREFMVYFASLDEFLSTGRMNTKLKATPIVDHFKYMYYYFASEGSVVYLQTNDGAPNSRIVAVDLNNPDPINWTTIVPEHKNNILEWVTNVDNDKMVLKYLVDIKDQLEVRSLTDGSLIQKIDIPAGTIDSEWGKKMHNEYFFRVVSFLTPGIIYRIDLTHKPYKPEMIREIVVPGFNPTEFVMKQVFYPSYDGTSIPMFIVHKKNLVLNSNGSTFLYGYGGFDVSILPAFSSIKIVFLRNFDGIYAVPNIRGGGEYGSKWHDNGRLLNKQNVFDDFQAAAEYLISENYTVASKIAINGLSNGGLLVAACVNQRPELYGAAIAQVGVHDLLRFQKFTLGYTSCSEYGCSDDGNQTIFDNLYRLSPLHNVRLPVDENVQYPAVLLTTADHDDQVVPLHSYKLIAELQFKIGRDKRQTNPLMIKIQSSAGHGVGKPTADKISEIAEFYTFLVESIGFVFKP